MFNEDFLILGNASANREFSQFVVSSLTQPQFDGFFNWTLPYRLDLILYGVTLYFCVIVKNIKGAIVAPRYCDVAEECVSCQVENKEHFGWQDESNA